MQSSTPIKARAYCNTISVARYDRRIPLLRHFIYKKLSVEKSQKDFSQKATAIKDFDSVNYKCESPSNFPVYHTK